MTQQKEVKSSTGFSGDGSTNSLIGHYNLSMSMSSLSVNSFRDESILSSAGSWRSGSCHPKRPWISFTEMAAYPAETFWPYFPWQIVPSSSPRQCQSSSMWSNLGRYHSSKHKEIPKMSFQNVLQEPNHTVPLWDFVVEDSKAGLEKNSLRTRI